MGFLVILVCSILAMNATSSWRITLLVLAFVGLVAMILPTLASHYIYDRSVLYRMPWLDGLPIPETIVAINAGFDEISPALRERYSHATLDVFDFYDPAMHTEPSIERARRAYPPATGVRKTATDLLPIPDHSVELVVAFLSLHEVRDHGERVRFLSEIRRTLNPAGHLVVTEHLRDSVNFIAFNFGFLHFHSPIVWKSAFTASGLAVERQVRTTPFITTYILAPQ
ncbi:MAG: methyltransferase domain-containing protein [Bacteroidetes bacterium]|nr:methyltransferase domain-containing protein [Bacteroidota bacterium]